MMKNKTPFVLLVILVTVLLAVFVVFDSAAAQGQNRDCPPTTEFLAKLNYPDDWEGASDAIVIRWQTPITLTWEVTGTYSVVASAVKAGRALSVTWHVPPLVAGDVYTSTTPNGQGISHVTWCSPGPTAVTLVRAEQKEEGFQRYLWSALVGFALGFGGGRILLEIYRLLRS